MEECILIPAYNAASTIYEVVSETVSYGYPVVVVDDGSMDNTPDLLEGLDVVVILHGFNRGKGAALRTGFAWAIDNGFDAVVTIDADGQHDPSAIPRLVSAAIEGKYGILLASRHDQFRDMAGLRKVWNRFGVWCMRKATGFEITDSQSGFRYYSTSLLRSVSLEKNGYDMEMEVLMKGWKRGFRIGAIPVPARVADGRSTSHFRAVPDTWNICMTYLRNL